MECSNVREKLSFYMDGVLDEQDLQLLEAHLNSCDSCRKELAALKILVQAATEIEDIEPPAALKQDIMKAIRLSEESDSICVQVSDILSAFIDDELPPARTQLVMTHLHACHSCSKEFEALKMIASAAQDVEIADPPADLRSRIGKAARAARRKEVFPIGLWLRHTLSPAALKWAGGTAAAGIAAVLIMTSINAPKQIEAHNTGQKRPVYTAAKPLQPKAPVDVPARAEKPVVTASVPDHPAQIETEIVVPVSERSKTSRHYRTDDHRVVAAAPSARASKAKSFSSRVKTVAKRPQTKAADTDLDYDVDPALDTENMEANAAVGEPERSEIERQAEHPKLIKLASAPSAKELIDQSSAEEWSRQAKAAAAMKRNEGGSGSIRIISTKF